MADDILIPVEDAALLLSSACDIMVYAKDEGSHLTIKSRKFASWNEESSVRILVDNGRRYVSKKAIIEALDDLGAFDEE